MNQQGLTFKQYEWYFGCYSTQCLLKELNQCLQNGSQQSLVLDDDECYDVMRRLINARNEEVN